MYSDSQYSACSAFARTNAIATALSDMRTDLFDFALPEDRIALRPAVPRDSARLLVVRPGASTPFEDRTMRELPALLREGDAVVVNDTKVIPASLHGRRIGRGDARTGDCGDADPAARRLALERAGEAGKAPHRRRCRALRQRGPGVLSRPARCHGGSERAGRRGHLRLRVSRTGARPGACRAWRHAAAALYRRPPPRRRAGPHRLPDGVRARGGIGRRADRRAAFHRRGYRGAAVARHWSAQGDAPRRAGHLPSGQGGRHVRAHDAAGIGQRRCRDGGGAQRRAARRRSYRRRRLDGAAASRKRGG